MNKNTFSLLTDAEDQAGGPSKPLPRRVVDLFLTKIFLGELKPGEKLPPDRVLAEQLGVDRNSLRAALSELAGRNVIKAVRGSGVVVQDYHEHAGLDFLDAIFDMHDINLGSAFNMEILDHWNVVIPAIVKTALSRATHQDLAVVDRLLMLELDMLNRNAPLQEIADVEVRIQDYLVDLTGSVILRLFANSMRGLRRQFARSFFNAADVREYVVNARSGFQDFMKGNMTPDEIAEKMRSYLMENTRPLRERISAFPPNPHRRSDIKKKEPEKGGTEAETLP